MVNVNLKKKKKKMYTGGEQGTLLFSPALSNGVQSSKKRKFLKYFKQIKNNKKKTTNL